MAEEQVEIEKAETSGKSIIRPITVTNKERGQPRIITSARFVDEIRKTELSNVPRRLCTYQSMWENDDAIFNSVDVTNLMVLMALSQGEFIPGKSNSSASREAANFLNYCIRNMSYGTWLEYCNNANTDIIYGWSFQNIVTEVRKHGKYKNMRCLRKLAPRNQRSIYGWVWDKEFRELQGFVQKQNVKQMSDPKLNEFVGDITFGNLSDPTMREQGYPLIRSNQMTHFRYNATDNNPQGDSPLLHCYDSYIEKKLIEQHECVGVTKDMAGVVVLKLPPEFIERANDSQNYPNEAAEYAALQTNAANLQNGTESFIVLSSGVDPLTKTPDYDIQFKGLEGGGKNYVTSQIIEQKRKSIYNIFGTGFLLLGQNGQGSYALSGTQKDMHSFYVQRNILHKKDVIDNQLAPTLLLSNNVHLDWEDMPTFKPKDPDELSLEELGKFIQRVASVNKLTLEAAEYLYDKSGLPTDGLEELAFTPDDDLEIQQQQSDMAVKAQKHTMKLQNESRAGESQGSSGTGSNVQVNSDVNMENKRLIVDGDRIIDVETDKVLNSSDLDSTGNYV